MRVLEALLALAVGGMGESVKPDLVSPSSASSLPTTPAYAAPKCLIILNCLFPSLCTEGFILGFLTFRPWTPSQNLVFNTCKYIGCRGSHCTAVHLSKYYRRQICDILIYVLYQHIKQQGPATEFMLSVVSA